MLSEISDDTLMELVEKHFNAVTFGNELKPDALLIIRLMAIQYQQRPLHSKEKNPRFRL